MEKMNFLPGLYFGLRPIREAISSFLVSVTTVVEISDEVVTETERHTDGNENIVRSSNLSSFIQLYELSPTLSK